MNAKITFTTPDRPDSDYSVVYENIKTPKSVFSKIIREILLRQRFGLLPTNFSVVYEDFGK